MTGQTPPPADRQFRPLRRRILRDTAVLPTLATLLNGVAGIEQGCPHSLKELFGLLCQRRLGVGRIRSGHFNGLFHNAPQGLRIILLPSFGKEARTGTPRYRSASSMLLMV